MFRYFSRLYEKHGIPVYPVAVLSFDKPVRPERNDFRVRFPGLDVVTFQFKVIQLNRLDWRAFFKDAQPRGERPDDQNEVCPEGSAAGYKLECLRMLVTLKLNPAKAALIGTFMDS